MTNDILNTLLLSGIKGATRAELADILLHSNEQHLVCAPVNKLVKLGLVVETSIRRANANTGGKGRVLLHPIVYAAYAELEGVE